MTEGNPATGGEFSILDLHEHPERKKKTPAYFRDLNLETVAGLLTNLWDRSLREYFLYLPETAEDEAYRRAVYGDVKKDAVYNALTEFVKRMQDADGLRREKEKVSDIRQKAAWQIRVTEVYCGACADLAEALEAADLSSEGMIRFRGILRETLEGEEYRQMREQTDEIMRKIRSLRMVITYEKDRIRVEPGVCPDEYEALPEKKAKPLRNPFAADPVISTLESECLDILRKKNPGIFREVLTSAERWGQYENPELERFRNEIRFYLSYAGLQREMEAYGCSFATPEVSDGQLMEASGLYDLALACVLKKKGKKVVVNDFRYGEGERFFVLTGPNQGGKTTFARSLGQLVYLTRIGLDVPAAKANVPFFPDIQTHFSVEESVETGRGKLKEELVRLAPMMEEHRQGTFVIINELFTTAASQDALAMGRKVLEHFIGLGCRGIYVTHRRELAAAHEQAVSLQAMLDGNRVQTFEIRRGEATDVPCADNLVNKYRLTYEQLKERL